MLERNVATLHRAGADFVLSYASMGANTILNFLGRASVLRTVRIQGYRRTVSAFHLLNLSLIEHVLDLRKTALVAPGH